MHDLSKLPIYICFKKVRAAKITNIVSNLNNNTYTMIFGEIGESAIFTKEWNERFKPEIGGYFVLYEDGYKSFSPTKAFEDGYKKI